MVDGATAALTSCYRVKSILLSIAVIEIVLSIAGILSIVIIEDDLTRCEHCTGPYGGWKGNTNYFYNSIQVPVTMSLLLAVWIFSALAAIFGLFRNQLSWLLPLWLMNASGVAVAAAALLYSTLARCYYPLLGCLGIITAFLFAAYAIGKAIAVHHSENSSGPELTPITRSAMH